MKKHFSDSEVTKVTDINMNYIQKFIETASEADIAWIEATFNKCRADVSKRAERQYFGNFRSKFAHEFYPNLFVAKETPAKESTLMKAIKERRAALNAAT